jgi:uncharacterized SAM-binding protein YcdF (DUF218 family)
VADMRQEPNNLRRAALGAALGALLGFFGRELELPSMVSYWGARPPLIVAAAVVGALLFLTRLRVIVAFFAIALGALWLVVAFTPLSRALAGGLARRDEPRAADAIFVFSSAVQADGEPTSPAMSRLLKGLELLGEGRAPRLILSELNPPAPPSAVYARALMTHLGLEGELLTVGPVGNTRDEAVAVGELARKLGIKTVIAVTTPLHAKRAALSLAREGLEVISVPSVETRYDLEHLDTPDDRLEAFGGAMHERLGLWVYEGRGWLASPEQ